MQLKYIPVLTFLFSPVLNAQQFAPNDSFNVDRIIGLDSMNVYQYRLIKYHPKSNRKTDYLNYLILKDNGKFDSANFGST